MAVAALRAEGGMLHVHANVGSAPADEAAWVERMLARLGALAAEANRTWDVTLVHLERVKWYAPRLRHVVADVCCRPAVDSRGPTCSLLRPPPSPQHPPPGRTPAPAGGDEDGADESDEPDEPEDSRTSDDASDEDEEGEGLAFYAPCCGERFTRALLSAALGGEALLSDGHEHASRLRCPACGTLTRLESITDAKTGESFVRHALMLRAQLASEACPFPLLSQLAISAGSFVAISEGSLPPGWLVSGLVRGAHDGATLPVGATMSASLAPPPPSPAHVLRKHGMLVDDFAVAAAAAAACCAEVHTALDEALVRPPGEGSGRFGEIRAPLHRYDLLLELTPSLLALLRQLLAPATPTGTAIAASLGVDATLVELSCVVSESGAIAQPAHCDTPADADVADIVAGNGAGASPLPQSDGLPLNDGRRPPSPPRLLTTFVALQDVAEDMGPTLAWPSTHIPAFHDVLRQKGARVLRSASGVRVDMRAGGAMLMECVRCSWMLMDAHGCTWTHMDAPPASCTSPHPCT